MIRRFLCALGFHVFGNKTLSKNLQHVSIVKKITEINGP